MGPGQFGMGVIPALRFCADGYLESAEQVPDPFGPVGGVGRPGGVEYHFGAIPEAVAEGLPG